MRKYHGQESITDENSDENMTDIRKNTSPHQVMVLGKPCTCDKCEHGCHHGSGALAKEDIPKLAKHLNITEQELKKRYLEKIEKFNTTLYRPKIMRKDGKPYGKCVFFDKEKKCTVHEAKPAECRYAMGCIPESEKISIWFTLNHFVNENDPESVRQYAQYLKSGGKTLSGGELHELVPDRETLKKILNYEILR